MKILDITNLKSIFDHNGKTWRVECWKGRYLAGARGAEIGVYIFSTMVSIVEYMVEYKCTKKPRIVGKTIYGLQASKKVTKKESEEEWYRAANKKEYIKMAYQLYGGYKDRKGRYQRNMKLSPILAPAKSTWWLTKFSFALPSETKISLVMDFQLTFKNEEMRDAYLDGLEKYASKQDFEKVSSPAETEYVFIRWRGL